MDPSKILEIREMATPKDRQAVQRFLGKINFLQRFVPNISKTTSTLKDLLKSDKVFHWDEQARGKSFKAILKI